MLPCGSVLSDELLERHGLFGPDEAQTASLRSSVHLCTLVKAGNGPLCELAQREFQ